MAARRRYLGRILRVQADPGDPNQKLVTFYSNVGSRVRTIQVPAKMSLAEIKQHIRKLLLREVKAEVDIFEG